MKKFLKANSALGLWNLLLVGIEMIVMIVLMLLFIKISDAFKIKFYDAFSWLPEGQNLNDIEFSLAMSNSFMKLSNEIVIPTILITGLVIIGIFAYISIRKGTKPIKKVSANELCNYIVIGTGLNLIITMLLEIIPKEVMENYNSAVGTIFGGNKLLLVLVVGIIGPLYEEVLFRYFEYQTLKKFNVAYAIVMTSIAFGVMHGNLVQGTYAFILGLIFAIVNYKKDNLLPSIVMHIAINLGSVILLDIPVTEITGLTIIFRMSILIKLAVWKASLELKKWKNE